MAFIHFVSAFLLSTILFMYAVFVRVPMISFRFVVLFPTAIFLFFVSFALFIRVLGNGTGTGTQITPIPTSTSTSTDARAAAHDLITRPDLDLDLISRSSLASQTVSPLAEKYTQQVLAHAATKLRLLSLESDLAARAATDTTLRAEITELKAAAARNHIELDGAITELATVKAESVTALDALAAAKDAELTATLDRVQRKWDGLVVKIAGKARAYEHKKRTQVKEAKAREQALRDEFEEFKGKSYTCIGRMSWIEERLLSRGADILALKKKVASRDAVVRDLRWDLFKANEDKARMRDEWEAAKVVEAVAAEYEAPMAASVVDELCAGIAWLSIADEEQEAWMPAEAAKPATAGGSGADAAPVPRLADSACSLPLPSPSSS